MILTLAYCLVCTNNSVAILVELIDSSVKGKLYPFDITITHSETGDTGTVELVIS